MAEQLDQWYATWFEMRKKVAAAAGVDFAEEEEFRIPRPIVPDIDRTDPMRHKHRRQKLATAGRGTGSSDATHQEGQSGNMDELAGSANLDEIYGDKTAEPAAATSAGAAEGDKEDGCAADEDSSKSHGKVGEVKDEERGGDAGNEGGEAGEGSAEAEASDDDGGLSESDTEAQAVMEEATEEEVHEEVEWSELLWELTVTHFRLTQWSQDAIQCGAVADLQDNEEMLHPLLKGLACRAVRDMVDMDKAKRLGVDVSHLDAENPTFASPESIITTAGTIRAMRRSRGNPLLYYPFGALHPRVRVLVLKALLDDKVLDPEDEIGYVIGLGSPVVLCHSALTRAVYSLIQAH